MKSLILALAISSGGAIADVPEISAWKVSCAHLKSEVAKYGSLTIVKKILLFKKRFYVQNKADCSGAYEYTIRGTFKTRDTKNCVVGEWCGDNTPSYSSDSGSYSSGSDYNYSSGSDYSSGGSSGSSDNRGPNYDPPSSGERGPRYCPGCAN